MVGTTKILPGTKTTTAGATLTLDTQLASSLSPGDTLYLSTVATDTVGALSAYIPVTPSLPYRFRLSVKKYTGPTITATLAAGIIWRNGAGDVVNSAVSSATTVTTSYSQVSIMGTAPLDAVYAEPYIRANFTAGTTVDQVVLIKNCAFWSPERINTASRTSNVATLVYTHIGTVPSVSDDIIVAGMGSSFDTTSATIASVSSVPIGTTNYNTVTITYSNTDSNTTIAKPLGYILTDLTSTITTDKYPGYYDVVADINQSTRDEESTMTKLKEVVRNNSPLGRTGVLSLNSVATSKAVGVTVGREPSYYISNKALTSNTATLTTTTTHALTVGQKVTVAGVDVTFNGNFTITGITDTTFSYAKTASDVPSAVVTPNGTVTSTSFQVTYTVPANTNIKVGHKVTVVGSYSASLVCQNETVVGTPTPTTFVIEKTSGTDASTTAAGTATFTPLLSGLVTVTPYTTTAYDV
jgi:hypothetical protein